MPNAAGQIWPHLPQGTPEPVERRQPSLADSMWPQLSQSARAREAQERRWANELAERNKKLAADLRELRMRLRER